MDGSILTDNLSTALYATDASVYRKIPLAVAFPKTVEDIQELINFASDNAVGLIPRTAGTSLAGQCVGEGIVVDVSKHFTQIVGLDKAKKQVTVQPGVIRDELNQYLEPHGLYFGPDTSTSNRCMIGGMVGNNSSGTTSIQYGVTRDKVVSMKTVLSDGSKVEFKSVTAEEFHQKTQLKTLEGKLYKELYKELSNKDIQTDIKREFPKPVSYTHLRAHETTSLISYSVFC